MSAVRIAWALLAAAALGACDRTPPAAYQRVGDPDQGRIIIGRQACGSCHEIPGLLWADGRAAPPLDGIARRTVIAGVLANTPDNMIRWLRAPQEVAPGNAMPDMGLTEAQARDVAAYLETLR